MTHLGLSAPMSRAGRVLGLQAINYGLVYVSVYVFVCVYVYVYI